MSNISGNKGNRTYFIISWDSEKNQYVFKLREYYGKDSQVSETIYLDNQKLSSINQRLPDVVGLLNKFNYHHTIPVKNYIEVNRLCDMLRYSMHIFSHSRTMLRNSLSDFSPIVTKV